MDLNKELTELKAKVTPVNTAKFLIGTLISFGAMEAVVATLKSPLQGAKGLMKLMMRLGIFVLGCKAGDVAEKYFSDTVDEIMKSFKEAREEEEKKHESASADQ